MCVSKYALPSQYHSLSLPFDFQAHRRGWRSIVKKLEGKGSPKWKEIEVRRFLVCEPHGGGGADSGRMAMGGPWG